MTDPALTSTPWPHSRVLYDYLPLKTCCELYASATCITIKYWKLKWTHNVSIKRISKFRNSSTLEEYLILYIVGKLEQRFIYRFEAFVQVLPK